MGGGQDPGQRGGTDDHAYPLARPPERWRLEKIPLGRFTTPTDIAGAVLFLASPAAEFITGQTILVDGRLTVA